VTLRIYRPRQWQAHDNDQWISAEMLEQLPMATPHRKVMRQLGERLA
jgi:hypothetical protein